MPAAPSTDWKEVIAPDEAARHEEYGRKMAELQRTRDAGRALGRALHVKQHVGARARFTTLPDLPAPYRVGIFAAAGEHDAWVRYSNGAAARQDDRKGDIRGVALKVLGVPGKKIIPGLEEATTQDFLLIQTPSFGFRDGHEFMFFIEAMRSPLTALPKIIGRLGLGRTLRLVRQLAHITGRKMESMAVERFWTPVPIRWGAHAAKYSLLPSARPTGAAAGNTPTFLADELVARLQRGPIDYDLAVQLYRDEQTTPIEDASVEWREDDAPFVTVARLHLPQQDLASEAGLRQREYVERLSFDPWHAPVEFRPLGHVMRARAETYKASVLTRSASPEPTDLELF